MRTQPNSRLYGSLGKSSLLFLLISLFSLQIKAQSVSTISGVPIDSVSSIMGVVIASADTFLGLSTTPKAFNNLEWQAGADWFDDRDSTFYGTVSIGDQSWLSENMRYLGTTSAVFYDADSATYHSYGRLYTRSEARNSERLTLSSPSGVQGVCPAGWHLPSTAEFDSLFTHINSSHTAGSSCSTCGGELKDTSSSHWNSPNTGANNSTGFHALGGGRFNGSSYAENGTGAYFWTASYNESSTTSQVFYILSSSSDQITFSSTFSNTIRQSVRCVKNTPDANAGDDQLIALASATSLDADSVVAPEVGQWSILSGVGGSITDSSDAKSKFSGISGNTYELVWTVVFASDTSRDTVKIDFAAANVNWQPGDDWLDDRDGETYGTVVIGNQTWMSENLRYSGSGLFYNKDSSTYAAFGKLYTQKEARNSERLTLSTPSGVQGACPVGWHLPSTAEFDSLLTTINSSHTAGSSCSSCGGELKEATTLYWSAPNTGANNRTRFSALGAGSYNGSSYTGIFTAANFWTASYHVSSVTSNVFYILSSTSDQITLTSTTSGSVRYSVRCVKNTPDANAGADQLIALGNSTNLDADSVTAPEVGQWSIISGTGGSITDSSDAKSKFTGLSGNTYELVWTVIFDPDTSRDTVKIDFSAANVNWQPGEDWLDDRDGETYGTVQIGNQTWMAENLRYKGSTSGSFYDDDSTTYAGFGRFYTRSEARNSERLTLSSPSGVQGVCPVGWHLPATAEFDTLFTHIKSSHTAESSCSSCAGEMKEASTLYWNAPNTSANNSTGFTALGSGNFTGSSYSSVYTNAYFWTGSYLTTSTTAQVYYILSNTSDQATITATTSGTIKLSVRCIKNVPDANAGDDQLIALGSAATLDADSVTAPEVGQWSIISGTGGSVTDSSNAKSAFTGVAGNTYELVWTVVFDPDTSRDTVKIDFAEANVNWQPGEDWLDARDGETYGTVKIGDQTWMSENLRYKGSTSAAFYDNDSTTYEAFGRYYTRSEARNSERLTLSSPSVVQGSCPVGWHLPSTAEFDSLLTTIKSSHTAESSCSTCSGELKEASTLYWNAPNTSATNSTGFTALGGGYFTGSSYSSIYSNAYFWTASYLTTSTTAQVYYLLSSSSDQITITATTSSTIRASVRCVKNKPDANAGDDQFLPGSNLTSLEADSAVSPEIGSWSIASGTGGTINDKGDPNSAFTGISGNTYELVWTVIFAPDTSRDTVLIDFDDANANWQPGTDWLDERDGEIYGTALIGNQTWMTENLRYLGSTSATFYDKDSTTYLDFGRLYTKAEARNSERTTLQSPSGVQGSCPTSWHLPSTAEYDTLLTLLDASHSGESSCASCGGHLKETGTLYWNAPNTSATNATNFSAWAGGIFSGSSYSAIYTNAYFWTASYFSTATANQVYYLLSSSSAQMTISSSASTTLRYSIRCVKDEVTANAGRDILSPGSANVTLDASEIYDPHQGTWTILSGIGGSVSETSNPKSKFGGVAGNRYTLEWAVIFNGDVARDTLIVDFGTANTNWSAGEDWLDSRDNETYGTVQIGNQVWMTENMRYLPSAKSVYHFDNDSASYHATRGRLYTHDDALDGATPKDSTPSGIQGICPTDWHVPSIQEFDSLLLSINSSHSAKSSCSSCGGALKQEYTLHWNAPNTSASNSSGFNALGAGYRSTTTFISGFVFTQFWTSSLFPSSSNGATYSLSNTTNQITYGSQSRTFYLSVRCVKD